jgi:hypothetical protein
MAKPKDPGKLDFVSAPANQPLNKLPVPTENEAEHDRLTEWIKLGDQVLGNDGKTRKKS